MRITVLLCTTILLPLLTSCGGGGDTVVADGGIGGTGVTMGKVSGFGSLYVNGVRYETDNADFIYEGETFPIGDDSGIDVGMVVRITGSDDGVIGEADIVEYADLLEGTISIQAITSSETGTLVAMGQTITVDPDTVYADGGLNTLLSQLPVGAIIEVSGFSDGYGNILATRIETKSLAYNGLDTLEVKGIVTSLDKTMSTLQLGALTVDFSSIPLPDSIIDGVYIEAKGILGNDIFTASKLEIEGDGDLAIAEDGEEAELEGVVSEILSFDPPNVLFILNGQQVLVNADTEYESGGDASNITIDQLIKAEGIMDDSALVAEKIELKVSSEEKEELKAAVDGINSSDDSFTLLGQTVKVTATTIYEDEKLDDQYFNLDSLLVGDFVEVDLYEASDGSLVATKLERKDNESSSDYAEIEGLVDSVDSVDRITVLNVPVDISALTEFSPTLGEWVEITGLYDGSVLIATQDEDEPEE